MARVFIGIGSNVGDRLYNISIALKALAAMEGNELRQLATLIETEPLGGPPQGRYLNTVVEIGTSISPRELVIALKAIERQLGREEIQGRWGPRPIDLDLLLYDDQVIQEPSCTVPHPRMHERLFVLAPLAQIAPDARHPIFGESVSSLLAKAQRAKAGSTRPFTNPV